MLRTRNAILEYLNSFITEYEQTALHGGGGLGPANFSEPAPFTFCPTFGEGDELGNVYGPEAILKTRSHVGSSERIRKVLRRAMAGLPISEFRKITKYTIASISRM